MPRAANASIKGFFYQFDHSIVQLLLAQDADATVVVEGVEDIDLIDSEIQTLIQCKYYEGTEYNHSAIKEAVIEMVKHFAKAGPSTSLFYRIYGHFQSGQEKLEAPLDLALLKNSFLTYKEKKIEQKVHVDLGLDDKKLKEFIDMLRIDIKGKSYDEQQDQIKKLFHSQIPECDEHDISLFFYPAAINVVRSLAIEKDATNRTITKRQFLARVNKKELVFTGWLRHKFGEEHYHKAAKRKYFTNVYTKVQKKARIFIIDVTNEFSLANLSVLLHLIATKFSHEELRRTTNTDRFCPFVHLVGLTPDELARTKGSLMQSGIQLLDGHAYLHAPFEPASLMRIPSKEFLWRLKFINIHDQIASVVPLIDGMLTEVFEFYKEIPVEGLNIGPAVTHHQIKVTSAYKIREIIQ